MTKAITKNSKKGFTLVELVVVIAILAILAAIAIPVVSSIINTASKNGALSDAQTIELAVKECQADIAARNDEVYDGATSYTTYTGTTATLPKASTNSTTAITIADVAGAKSVNNAFHTVTYNGADFQLYWDVNADKCLYLCTTANSSGTIVVGANLASEDLSSAYVPGSGSSGDIGDSAKCPKLMATTTSGTKTLEGPDSAVKVNSL